MANYQKIRIDSSLIIELVRMFDELPETYQILDRTSPRPGVVHRTMGQLTFVASGQGRGMFNGERCELNAGDLILIGADCTHAFASDSEMLLRHFHWPQAALDTDRHILTDRVDGF